MKRKKRGRMIFRDELPILLETMGDRTPTCDTERTLKGKNCPANLCWDYGQSESRKPIWSLPKPCIYSHGGGWIYCLTWLEKHGFKVRHTIAQILAPSFTDVILISEQIT
jgi:hypothetical protein